MTSLKAAIAIASSSTALTGAGGIAALSLFDIPELQSQPASRSLPQIRWLFSRGSHVFPSVAFAAGTGFLYLAYDAVPAHLTAVQGLTHALRGISNIGTPAGKAGSFLLAGLLALSIGPVTSIMIPTNFRLIELNEAKGGSRSEASAKKAKSAGVAFLALASLRDAGVSVGDRILSEIGMYNIHCTYCTCRAHSYLPIAWNVFFLSLAQLSFQETDRGTTCVGI
nr:hypothetical protein B0A51_10316 [Rachicladosporium sp. CCFEE 5018]